MTTRTLSSTFGPAAAVGLPRPLSLAPASWAARLASTAREAWRRWRAERQQQRAIRLLAQLDPRTLKDVGLGEFAAPGAHRWPDLHRAGW